MIDIKIVCTYDLDGQEKEYIQFVKYYIKDLNKYFSDSLIYLVLNVAVIRNLLDVKKKANKIENLYF